MEQDAVVVLRADVAALRNDMAGIRQDIGMLEAKADSMEAWRVRYLVQADQLIDRLFAKVEELVSALSDMRVDISRLRGERDAERRASMMIISILSAAVGGLMTNLFHG